MATYGKRRHILPLLSGTKGTIESTETKRHKAGIHGSLPCNKSKARGTDRSSPPGLSLCDSIDELAAILLDDTIMEDCCNDQDEVIGPSHGFAACVNNSSRVSSVPSHFNRGAPLMLHAPSQRYRTAMSPLNAHEPGGRQLEEILPASAIRSDNFLIEHHEISQPKAFSPNSMANLENMEAIAIKSKEFKPDESFSLHSGEHLKAEDQCLGTRNNLHDAVKTETWQSPRSKPSNFIDNNCAPIDYHSAPQAKSLGYNPDELNSKIQAMMAATQALKPDGAASVRPAPYSPAHNSRMKDGNVLSKMKTAMSHPFQTLTNKKSPDSTELHSYIRVISQPQLISRDVVPQSAVLEHRVNEGGNLQNPRTVNMTGHGQIRRRPLPNDGKYPRSQNPTSYQITQSASEPILELSSDTLSGKVDISAAGLATEPFPLYDSNYDVPFSSSPIAQSTPRIHIHPALEDEDVRVKSLPFSCHSPAKMGINKNCFRESDMAFTPSLQSDCTKERTKLSTRSSNAGRTKKHPSPSKAQLEKWEDFMNRYPSPDLVASLGQASGVCDAKVSLHPLSHVLTLKSTNIKVRESTENEEKKNNTTDKLQSRLPDVKKSTADDHSSRIKGRKSYVSKHRCSKPRSRESIRSSRSRSLTAARGSDAMEIDELQGNEPGLLRKAT